MSKDEPKAAANAIVSLYEVPFVSAYFNSDLKIAICFVKFEYLQ